MSDASAGKKVCVTVCATVCAKVLRQSLGHSSRQSSLPTFDVNFVCSKKWVSTKQERREEKTKFTLKKRRIEWQKSFHSSTLILFWQSFTAWNPKSSKCCKKIYPPTPFFHKIKLAPDNIHSSPNSRCWVVSIYWGSVHISCLLHF